MFGRKKPTTTATYFRLVPAGAPTGGGSATVPPGFGNEYQGHGHTYHSWDAPTFHYKGGAASDLLPNDAGLMLCSAALRAKLASAADPKDILDWLPVNIDGLADPYFLLCLPYRKKVQVLRQGNINPETEGVKGEPPISQPAVGPHKVFTYLDPRPDRCHDVLLAGPAADALRSSGLTGFTLEALPVSGSDVLSELRPTLVSG